MSDPIFNPVEGNNSFIKNLDEYKNLYEQSVNDPSKFLGILQNKTFIGWKTLKMFIMVSLQILGGLMVVKQISVLIVLIGI